MTKFEIKPEQWRMTFSRNSSLFFSYLFAEGIRDHMQDFEINESVDRIGVGKAYFTDNFLSLLSLKASSEEIAKAALQKGYVEKIRKMIIERGERLTEISEKIAKFKGDLKQGKNLFIEYLNAYKSLSPALWITMSLGRTYSEKLIEEIKERIGGQDSNAEIESMISILTYPNESTPMMEEEISLLKICIKLQNNEKFNFEQELRKHYEKFRYIPANFVDEAWSLDYFREEIENNLKRLDCKKKLEELENNKKKLIEERERLIKKAGFTDKELFYAKILRETTFLNELRKFYFAKAQYLIRDFLTYFGEKIELGNWEEMFYLTHYEILDLFDKKNIDKYKTHIKKRKRIYVIIRDNKGKLYLLEDQEAKEIKDKLIYPTPVKEKGEERITEIKGMIANKGIAKGKAKIVHTAKELGKVNRGDILVAKMTGVDFISAMKIAGGFVTDEGGITCHASIVARELGVPCIIGTKIATQVLKDGDEVEVDANEGVVRIVKRK